MRKWHEEPLVRFAVAGALIFAVHAAVAEPRADADETPPIVVSDAFLDGLRERHRRRAGSDADDADLVRQYARDEALFREARRLGLDRGDAIVRRRLVQKMEMLLRTSASPVAVSDAELEAWVEAHADDYRAPARVTFEHAWFSRDRRDDAEADARAALARLHAPDRPAAPGAADASRELAGDAFPLGRHFVARPVDRIASELGPAVAEALADAPLDTWVGPIDGALGVHLLRVTAREPGGVPPLDAIRDRAIADWSRAQTDAAFDAAVAELVERYGVTRVAE